MKEFVAIKFVSTPAEYQQLVDLVMELNTDEFIISLEWNSLAGFGREIVGKITSEYASVVKLRYKFLADRMHISYIDEDLKDKYRGK